MDKQVCPLVKVTCSFVDQCIYRVEGKCVWTAIKKKELVNALPK